MTRSKTAMIPTRDLAVRAVGALLHHQPMTPAKLRFAWECAVGAGMARVTSVTLDAAGLLHVTAENGHWRREVIRSASVIMARLGGLLGTDQVKRMTVTIKGHA